MGSQEPEEIIPQQQEPQTEAVRESLLRRTIESTIQKTVNESALPNEEYKSTVGVYGGKMKMEDGKLVWDRRGIVSKIDNKSTVWGLMNNLSAIAFVSKPLPNNCNIFISCSEIFLGGSRHFSSRL